MARVVIKVGSAVLTQDGELALERLANLVEFIAALKQKNNDIILVSSGAVAAGYTLLKLDKTLVPNKQTLASLGQPLLLDTYRKKFSKYNLLCSQVLLEATIFDDTTRLNHAKEAIKVMLENNIIPIINENDVTAIDELVFGDNDQLSAHVAHNFDANMLVILTDIDGYYDDNPKTNPNAKLLKVVSSISKDELEATSTANSEFATGGIVTKLKAADFLLKNNKQMFLANGFDLTNIEKYMLEGIHESGTLFTK